MGTNEGGVRSEHESAGAIDAHADCVGRRRASGSLGLPPRSEVKMPPPTRSCCVAVYRSVVPAPESLLLLSRPGPFEAARLCDEPIGPAGRAGRDASPRRGRSGDRGPTAGTSGRRHDERGMPKGHDEPPGGGVGRGRHASHPRKELLRRNGRLVRPGGDCAARGEGGYAREQTVVSSAMAMVRRGASGSGGVQSAWETNSATVAAMRASLA